MYYINYYMNKRIDLHMHSLFSDGELLPSELARRALKLNHEAIAITDHVDYSNIPLTSLFLFLVDFNA